MNAAQISGITDTTVPNLVTDPEREAARVATERRLARRCVARIAQRIGATSGDLAAVLDALGLG